MSRPVCKRSRSLLQAPTSAQDTPQLDVLDLSHDEIEAPKEPRKQQKVIQASGSRRKYQPLHQRRDRPNFTPHVFQEDFDQKLRSASHEIAALHRSAQWHYRWLMDCFEQIGLTETRASADLATILDDARKAGHQVHHEYSLEFQEGGLVADPLRRYVALFKEACPSSSDKSSVDRHKFDRIAEKNAGESSIRNDKTHLCGDAELEHAHSAAHICTGSVHGTAGARLPAGSAATSQPSTLFQLAEWPSG